MAKLAQIAYDLSSANTGGGAGTATGPSIACLHAGQVTLFVTKVTGTPADFDSNAIELSTDGGATWIDNATTGVALLTVLGEPIPQFVAGLATAVVVFLMVGGAGGALACTHIRYKLHSTSAASFTYQAVLTGSPITL